MSDRSVDPREHGEGLATPASIVASSFAATSFVVLVAYGAWLLLQVLWP
jgi:hypothetical protein